MLSRILGMALISGAMVVPAVAGQMSPEEARQFIAGKYFAFTCFDGSRGAGRIQNDGSVAGTIQFGGTGAVRFAHLPTNTIRVGQTAVCASLKGLPFEPCFNLEKTDEVSFRGSVSGMGFAYCDFRKHGNSILVARARVRPRILHPAAAIDSAKPEQAKVEAKPEPVAELRRSQD